MQLREGAHEVRLANTRCCGPRLAVDNGNSQWMTDPAIVSWWFTTSERLADPAFVGRITDAANATSMICCSAAACHT